MSEAITHGTWSGYVQGCRCDPCNTAHIERLKGRIPLPLFGGPLVTEPVDPVSPPIVGDPFLLPDAALVSFSGGRTSGYMLRRVLDAFGGTLPGDIHALFANTGKERIETLDFVRDVQVHWGVIVHWVERDPATGGMREVTYETASRNGEPFAALIEERKFLPNPVTRFCTTELKIRPMRDWMTAHGYEHWTNVVGIRADEQRRLAKRKGRKVRERYSEAFPLARAGITKAHVLTYWARQSFDLHLQPWEGNCDLCMLKGVAKRQRIMRDRPDLARWWIERELAGHRMGWSSAGKHAASFRADTPSYATLLERAQEPMLFDDVDDLTDLGDCECDLEAT